MGNYAGKKEAQPGAVVSLYYGGDGPPVRTFSPKHQRTVSDFRARRVECAFSIWKRCAMKPSYKPNEQTAHMTDGKTEPE